MESLIHSRMDWGLGNPNKTAALIALIMIAVWILGYIRDWGFWVALALFTGFGVCLILTQSRGLPMPSKTSHSSRMTWVGSAPKVSIAIL
jgi:hypothetical protein